MIADNFHKQLDKLHQQLVDHFSDEELRTLCFSLGINYDGLPGQEIDGKARELILRAVRTNKMAEFIEKCREVRGNVPWEFTFPGTPDSPTVALDDMFHEAAHYQIMGDLGYALQLYRQLQQIAPGYPRIGPTIASVEQEMRATYVGPDLRVKSEDVFKAGPERPERRVGGGVCGIVVVTVVLAIVVLVYLWLRSRGG
jgi:hypothetical protein